LCFFYFFVKCVRWITSSRPCAAAVGYAQSPGPSRRGHARSRPHSTHNDERDFFFFLVKGGLGPPLSYRESPRPSGVFSKDPVGLLIHLKWVLSDLRPKLRKAIEAAPATT
jgi:hypothetical protein